jgi:hypothetical protein
VDQWRGLDWNCLEALEIVTGLFGLVAIVLTTRWLGMKDRFEPCAQISRRECTPCNAETLSYPTVWLGRIESEVVPLYAGFEGIVSPMILSVQFSPNMNRVIS